MWVRRGISALAVASLTATLAVTTESPARAQSVPAFDHVFLIVMENHAYDEVIGSSAAPYISSLASAGAVASWYYAVTHPSLPNYLALAGGSTFGITSDCTTCWISASNLADVLEAAGRSWKAYEESMPSTCYVGDSYPYAQKHDPFIYFNDIRNNSTRCKSHIVPYSQLSTDLASTSTTPSFGFITPNMCDDMHDCTVASGDTWLKNNVPSILGSAAFKGQRSLLAVTWDEDDSSASNNVATIFAGTGVKPGYISTTTYNHYSLLRTIEEGLGVGTITTSTGDASASPMADMFAATPCTGATLTSSTPAPVAPGPTVTLTAGAACSGTPEYRFLVGSSIVQGYGPANTYAWSTAGLATGTYRLEVDVRNEGSTAGYEAWASLAFVLGVATRCGTPGLTASPSGHAPTGGTVTLSATTSACGTPLYRFLVGQNGKWSVIQPYSSSSAFAWSSAGQAAGSLVLEVDVRDQSSPYSYDGWAQISYTLVACSAAHLSIGASSPQPVGSAIALSATATCPATAQYRFLVGQGGTWTVAQAYGSSSTFTWSTAGKTAGTYTLEVDVRNQGSTLGYEAWSNSTFSLS